MSTAESSLPRPSALATARSLLSTLRQSAIAAVRGVAFWATIPLPLVIVGTLVTGTAASTPLLVVGLLLLNVVCAVVGQRHSTGN